uniref:Uncharacterized protein n=1 Tax=Myotis myotis TaxID=51298 RepID=A0A7J7XHV8_MYOMY|nr:hypothetical protein mMyoMyo1_011658 [Myotis myotis]
MLAGSYERGAWGDGEREARPGAAAGAPYSFPPRQPAGGSQATEPRPVSGLGPQGEGLDVLRPRSPRLQTERKLAGGRASWSFKAPAGTFQPKLRASPGPGRLLRPGGAEPQGVHPVKSSPLMGADTSGLLGIDIPKPFSLGSEAARAPRVFILLCYGNEARHSCSPLPTPAPNFP